MPLSQSFLSHFKDFVQNYKSKGTPAFYQWSKEQNHPVISNYFDELLVLITQRSESFHDASIIDHLNATMIISSDTNPYLLVCWKNFLLKYNAEKNCYSPIGSMHIKIGVDGTPSENLVRDLQSALESSQQALTHAQTAHNTESELLKRQLETIRDENARLVSQNLTLRDQVQNEEAFRMLDPQIQASQKQLTTLSELFANLSQITGKKFAPMPVSPIMPIPGQKKEVSHSPNATQVELPVEQIAIVKSPEQSSDKSSAALNPPQITDAPKSDALAPPAHIKQTGAIPKPPVSPSDIPGSQTTKSSGARPLLGNGSGFFNELTDVIQNRKLKHVTPDDAQKKKIIR